MSDWSKHFRQRQGRATRWLCGGIVLLTTILMGQHLADGNSPAFHFHPLSPPNALAPTGASSAETDPDPRAAELAERLHQYLDDLHSPPHQTPQPTSRQRHILSQLRAQSAGDVSVWLHPTAGTPRQIKGQVLQRAQYSSLLGALWGKDAHEETAQTFLQTNRALLRLDDPQAELALTRRETDDLGRTHLRFDQTYQGLPVWPAEMIVHLDPNGHVDLLNGVFVPTPKKLDTTPVLDKSTAVEYARTGLTDGDQAEVSASELIIYAPGDAPPRLAWKLELTISLTSRWLVVIDALNGDELTAYSQVMHQQVSGSGVDLFGARRPLNVWQEDGFFWMVDTSESGVIVVHDARNLPFPPTSTSLYVVGSSSPTSGWLPDAVSVSYNLSQAYDYYRERHGRDSFDGRGRSIPAIVRVGGEHRRNAFWNGVVLGFGDGLPFAGALDVVGHELTHGVIEHSANLVYQNQPGALNEAFADIFGEMIEARTMGRPDWIIGSVFGDRQLRNMADPASLLTFDGVPYPTRMSEFVDTQEDNGGVHINSSIINRAYYLLAAGLDGAIGLRDAERIFYRALVFHLTPQSQFIDARLACIQAAEELFRAGSAQARKTAEAFDVVEIRAAPPTPDPPDIPAVQGPDASLFVYRDASGRFRLGRLEDARGDEVPGIQLADAVVARSRPSVSRDGSFAVFVNDQNDVCLIGTDGGEEECIPSVVASVAMSPDARFFGFVFLNAQGNPDNQISVIDLETNRSRTFILETPAYDGPATDTILLADAMDFTSDGQWVIYDALTGITFADGFQLRQWSLYALHLATGTNYPLTTPTPGLNIAWPALSQTSDNFLTFDVFDEDRNQSTIYAANLNTGELESVATVRGSFGVPGYTGDDSAIVFSQRDPGTPTGVSLFRQPLAADRITPRGRASVWLRNADYGVIYRRQGAPSNPGAGALGNPSPDSFQSGIGLFSGWVCDAGRVEIEINGSTTLEAAYGTVREDTASVCGDTDNGFGLLFNWNRLGNGTHTARALADGVEFGRATFTVTTLGTEFLRGVSGGYRLPDFPRNGQEVDIVWQQASQNFVIAGARNVGLSSVAGPTNDVQAATHGPRGALGNPSPNSFQSGIGLFSGWVCDAGRVEIEINGSTTLEAGYGTVREDTAGICGDTNNGFGLLFNWNRLGNGTHTARALADGVEFGRATFTVTTLGTEFLRGVGGSYTLGDFPRDGQNVHIEWQQASQNFVITGVR